MNPFRRNKEVKLSPRDLLYLKQIGKEAIIPLGCLSEEEKLQRKNRLKSEEILRRIRDKSQEILDKVKIHDHLGNVYKSKKQMCDAYGVTYGTFRSRMYVGWTLERALTTPIGCVDENGEHFSSIKDMCKQYNVPYATYFSRLKLSKRGLSNLGVINENTGEIEYIDHNGKKFKTVKDMCKYHNVKYCTFRGRILNGWSVKSALTNPIKSSNKESIDHLGNVYDKKLDMCAAYGISLSLFNCRINKGWSIKDALTKPIQSEFSKYK